MVTLDLDVILAVKEKISIILWSAAIIAAGALDYEAKRDCPNIFIIRSGMAICAFYCALCVLSALQFHEDPSMLSIDQWEEGRGSGRGFNRLSG